MPTYVYETVPTDGSAPTTFEVQQKMADEPLTVHPETGVPVVRVLSAPFIGGKAGADAPAPSAAPMGCGMGGGMCGGGMCGMGGLGDN